MIRALYPPAAVLASELLWWAGYHLAIPVDFWRAVVFLLLLGLYLPRPPRDA